MKITLAASLLAMLVATPAYSQQSTTLPSSAPAATQLREIKDDDRLVPAFNLTVDKLEDRHVVNAAGDRIGEIEEVLENGAGEPVALVIETGGFIGIGGKEVLIGFDQVRREGDRLVTSLTKEQIATLPEWKD